VSFVPIVAVQASEQAEETVPEQEAAVNK
jgi:hypothetical protein